MRNEYHNYELVTYYFEKRSHNNDLAYNNEKLSCNYGLVSQNNNKKNHELIS